MPQLSKLILPTVVIGGAAVVAWGLVSARTFVVESEREVRSMQLAVMLLEVFVREHKSWPHSWVELADVEDVAELISQSDVDWDGLKRSVTIDFEYDMRTELDTEAFTALRPVKGYYAYRPEEFSLLRAAIRDTVLTKIDDPKH